MTKNGTAMKTTKYCYACKTHKDNTKFAKNKRNKDGLQYECKLCQKTESKKYYKTKNGVISKIYTKQKENSKKRNHKLPSYTRQQLSEWLLNDWLFDLLYTNWCNCGYATSIKPSIDRIEDDKSYSFDNIQVMTWGENENKNYIDTRNATTIRKVKPHKPVQQLTLDGIFIKDFVSASEAERQLAIHQSDISKCCRELAQTAGSYKWRFTND